MRNSTALLLLLPLLGVPLAASGDAPAKKPPPPDMAAPAPPPSKLTRALSDAWGYNRLQASVLEAQKKELERQLKLNDEALVKLGAGRVELDKQLKDQFRVDVAAGDSWDETTLEIRRK